MVYFFKNVQAKKLRKNTAEAMKKNGGFKALQIWQKFCKLCPRHLESVTGTLDLLTRFNDLDEALRFYSTEVADGKLGHEKIRGLMESFQEALTNGDHEKAINTAGEILHLFPAAEHAGGCLYGWLYYMVESLNEIYHNNVKIDNKWNTRDLFVHLVQEERFSEALIFYPLVLRRGKFSLILYYFSQLNEVDYKDHAAMIQALSSVERLVAAYQLSKGNEKALALSFFNQALHENSRLPHFFYAEAAYLNAREGNIREARNRFGECLDRAGFYGNEKGIWLDSFNKVIDAHGRGPSPYGTDAGTGNKGPVKNIFFSGFGWSGSGAVYDYLKEFRGMAINVPTELRFVETKHGMGDLYKEIAVQETIDQERLMLLFSQHLFGFSCVDSYNEAKNYWKARHLVMHASRGYAILANRFLAHILRLDSRSSPDTFRRAFNVFFDAVCRLYMEDGDGHVLLDNVIKAYKLHHIDLFDNAAVIVVKRDPRSQYVARYYEDSKARLKDVDKFIANYRKSHGLFTKQVQQLRNPDSVIVVQFEDFVLSQEYRCAVAKHLALDLGQREEHSFFKPWESAKNVDNYMRFPDQAPIKKIARELPGHLYDMKQRSGEI